MAQLIQMRQQIRAIESIEKITHAMRLISMSSHSQLNHKAPLIENYKNELFKILQILQFKEEIKSNLLIPTAPEKRTLIIVIGSQKGLAGTFNSSLYRMLEKNLKEYNYEKMDFISVGKKTTDYLKKHEKTPFKSFNIFNIHNLSKIASEIFDTIIKANPNYTDVIFFSNYPKSFFVQVPQANVLIPTKQKEFKSNNIKESEIDIETYVWEQPIQDIFDYLTKEFLHFSIQSLLFNSLLAEHAARFQFMNNATKNAEDLLNQLKLQYNKIRQAKITKEITELSANL